MIALNYAKIKAMASYAISFASIFHSQRHFLWRQK